jgi:quinol monooxygenase YgiN
MGSKRWADLAVGMGYAGQIASSIKSSKEIHVSTGIDALFTYRIKPGKQEVFQSYLDKVLPVTEAEEAYVLSYEIFQGDDGTYYQHERYESEDAIWKHMEVTAAGQQDFSDAAEILAVNILGDVSPKFRETYGIATNYTPFRRIAR